MDYSLVQWDIEYTHSGVTYTSDDYTITGDYIGLHSEIREWVLYSFNGYQIRKFKDLEAAMREVEYRIENQE